MGRYFFVPIPLYLRSFYWTTYCSPTLKPLLCFKEKQIIQGTWWSLPFHTREKLCVELPLFTRLSFCICNKQLLGTMRTILYDPCRLCHTLSFNQCILNPCWMPSSGHCADSGGTRMLSGWTLAFQFLTNIQTDHHSARSLIRAMTELKSREPSKMEEGHLIAV